MNDIDWLQAITDDSTATIAVKAGISKRTLNHQIAREHLSVENVLAIAMAYDHHPLRALIDLGHVDPAWSQVPDVVGALRLASDYQIADEVLRRMLDGRAHTAFTTPVENLDTGHRDGPPTPHIVQFDPERSVADSSPFHPEENTDFDD